MKKMIFVLSIFLFQIHLHAGDFPELGPIQKKLWEFDKEGNYFGPISLLRTETQKGDKEKEKWSQTLSAHLSNVGLYAEAVKMVHAAWLPPQEGRIPPSEEQKFLEAIDLNPAVQSICDIAKKQQIVILNENHHHPQHRTFGRKLLQCFKDAGFKHFALEAINEETHEINQRGHVSRIKTGYYTHEPQMAGLINDALSSGFKIIRYEARSFCQNCSIEDQIDQREEEQANNLVEEIFSNEPNAKVLIWVGFAHAYKRQMGTSPKSRWMAARLWEKTGIEPYCIEQLLDQFEYNTNQPEFISINKALPDANPVFVDIVKHWEQIPESYKIRFRKTRKEINPHPAIDAIVVHKTRSENDSRALWLNAQQENILKIQIESPAKGDSDDFLIQVFSLQETDMTDIVPLDQIRCGIGEICQIILPPHPYQLRAWDKEKIISVQEYDLKSNVLNNLSL